MTAVLDTNLIVSATYFAGTPAIILEHTVRKDFSVALSVEILAEYVEVVHDLSSEYTARANWLEATLSVAKFFEPAPVPSICSDPDDEMFIRCAVAASADYIVSGDKRHLLKLKTAHGIPVI